MENKTKRKVFAATASAALVASAVVPAATFAETNVSFPDLKGYGWATDAISYLVKKGALNGYEDGTFRPANAITRAEAAKILAIALDLEIDKDAKAEFTDAKDHWSSPYIAAIVKQTEGVIEGYEDGTFRPDRNITRQEMAKMVVTAYDLKLNEDADVSFEDNNGWGKEYVEILASLGVVQGREAGKFAPNANVTRAETTVFVHRTEVPEVRLEVPKKPVTELAVESVKAINLAQIEVKFNQEVDEDSAETLARYTLNGSALPTGSFAKLQDDNKTVLITLGNVETQNSKKFVEVDGVLAKDSLKVAPKYRAEVTFSDTTAPNVKSVKAVGNKKLVVTFSEPVKNVTTSTNYDKFRINGQTLTSLGISSVSFPEGETITHNSQTFGNKIEFTFGVALPAGTHKLTVNEGNANRIEDLVGLPFGSQDVEFTVKEITTKPTATVVSANTNGDVELKFDREMDKSKFEVTGAFKINGNPIDASNVKLESDDVTVKISAGSSVIKEGTNILEIHKDVEDLYGNKVGDNVRIAFNAEEDKIAPTVSAVFMPNDKEIQVRFSESVDSAFAQSRSNYKIKDATGKDVTSEYLTTDGTYNSSNKTVKFTLAKGLPGASYTLEVSNVKDLSGNVMSKYTTTLTSPDKTAPQIVGSTAYQNTNNRTVTIFFNEEMATSGNGSIYNTANYFVKVNETWKTLNEANVTISAGVDTKSVVLNYPADNVPTDVRVANVTDVSGNLLDGISKDLRVSTTPDPDVSPKLVAKSAVLKEDSNKVWVEFETNRPITDVTASGVKLVDSNGTSVASGDTQVVAGNKVQIIFNTGTKAAEIRAKGNGLYLNFDEKALKDSQGIGVNALTDINNDTKVKDQLAPKLKEYVNSSTTPIEVTGADEITITFTEAISGGNLDELKDDISVTTGGTVAEVDSVRVEENKVVYKLKKNLAGTVTLKFNESNISIKDLAGNVYVPSSDDKKTWTVTLEGATSSVVTAENAPNLGQAVNDDGKLEIVVGSTIYSLDLSGTNAYKFNEITDLVNAIKDAEDSSNNKLSDVADVTVDNDKIKITLKTPGQTTLTVRASGNSSGDVLTLTGFTQGQTDTGSNAATTGGFTR